MILSYRPLEQIKTTILSGIAGTPLMTMGSEIMSLIFRENFREPKNLETIDRAVSAKPFKTCEENHGLRCPLCHGLIFAAVYLELWETKKSPTI